MRYKDCVANQATKNRLRDAQIVALVKDELDDYLSEYPDGSRVALALRVMGIVREEDSKWTIG